MLKPAFFYSSQQSLKAAFLKYTQGINLKGNQDTQLEKPKYRRNQIDYSNFCEHFQDILEYNRSPVRSNSFQKIRDYGLIRNSMRQIFSDLIRENYDCSICKKELVEVNDVSTKNPVHFINRKEVCHNCEHSRYIPSSILMERVVKEHSSFFEKKDIRDILNSFSRYDEKLSVENVCKEANGKKKDLTCVSYVDITKKTKFSPVETNKKLDNKKIFYPITSSDKIYKNILYKPIVSSPRDLHLINIRIRRIARDILTGSNYGAIDKVLMNRIKLGASKVILPNEYVRVTLFGSRVAELNSRTSDYDFNLSVFTENGKIKKVNKSFIQKVAKEMRGVGYIAFPILAKIPIIKIIPGRRGREFNADVSFGNMDGIIKSVMLKLYTKADPRVKNLILWIKKWANNRLIVDGTLYLNTFGYSLLMLTYLAQEGVIKPFSEIAENMIRTINPSKPNALEDSDQSNSVLDEKTHSPDERSDYASNLERLKNYVQNCLAKNIDPYHKSFETIKIDPSKQNTKTEAELLIGFFRYFGFEHNFITNVVNLELGSCMKPKKVDEGSPIDLIISKQGRPLQIDDPTNPDMNNARNLSPENLVMIISEMRRAFFILNFGNIIISDITAKVVDIALQESIYVTRKKEFWLTECEHILNFDEKSSDKVSLGSP